MAIRFVIFDDWASRRKIESQPRLNWRKPVPQAAAEALEKIREPVSDWPGPARPWGIEQAL